MPYFFATRTGDLVEITGVDARHLAGALRARPGERIKVVEPAGRLLTVRLETVGPTRVSGQVVTEVEHHPEPDRSIVMALAMLPATALEQALSRCTEAGAGGFTLLSADRSIARASKPERWAAICREATMLAGRLRVPRVEGPVPFRSAWERAREPWLLDRSGQPLRPLPDGAVLFVGPEGGWSERELEIAGDRVVTLGPRNLRADTAALVGLTLALADPDPWSQT